MGRTPEPAEAPVELGGAEFAADPYATYERLRAKGPVHWVRAAEVGETWLVVGHEAAREALADGRLSKDRSVMADRGDEPPARANMLNSDPPLHPRLRRLVAREFTTRRVAALRPRVQRITDELLDAAMSRPSADLVEALAFPLPMNVICELLGVPDLDRETFRNWSNDFITGDPHTERTAIGAMSVYLAELIEAKRAGAPADDLLSALIRTRDEDGDKLSADELVGMAFLLLIAGHETTVNLITNGVLALLRHPDQLAALRADPGLIDGAVEEMLRYDGPVETTTWRFAREPLTIGGTHIARGDSVLVSLAAADRDPQRFPEPDTFDILRPPQGNIAFGHGIHYCLGAPLARLEAKVAIPTLLARAPGLTLAAEPPAWRQGLIVRGPTTLHVRF
ncbi:cytochrome P450 family protein [Actinacidiphila epipremni]|uniref:Cytochrome P450 n=1 Tax=Actinacidiphila epipremni TaxID=2053013 RepID=A0ABX0ZH51_9ACTN|nr:cytochrome P450 [Actinacidiphila epipremni]NJP42360.1 cytochrome P450 [Actinacidiphila epipremni]